MPKKSPAARSAAQRNRPRTHKSFELVRPTSLEEQEPGANTGVERTPVVVSNTPAATAATVTPIATVETSEVQKEQERKESTASPVSVSSSTVSQGSAAARLAARRQTVQKAPQRSSVSLITPEHYSYVRKDLIFIAILAAIMFSVIIILHFVPGIGG